MKQASPILSEISSSRASRSALSCLIVGVFTLTSQVGQAETIINQPGNHPKYSVELEPHLLLGWANIDTNDPFPNRVNFNNSAGIGPGLRVSIPLVDNGFVKKINNDVALGFGIDWAHYGGADANVLWFPIVMQWNFHLTDVITVFGEPGGAFRYVSVRGNSEFHADGVLHLGAKFSFGVTRGSVRAGYPYFSAGLTLLL